MIKRIYILLFAGLSLFSCTGIFAQPAIYRQFELGANYQPAVINKMTQDPYGRLWLGTTKGLLSFDGTDFSYQAFRDSSSLNITAIACDTSFVYTGYEDGKIGRYSLKSWEREFVIDTNLQATITSIRSGSGSIYIATYGNGLFIKKGNQLTQITKNDGLPENEIYSMILDRKGTVWLGTDGGLTSCSLDGNKPVLKTYARKDGFPDEIVRCLAEDDSGDIWIGTYDKGVCVFDPVTAKVSVPPFSLNWSRGPVTALALQGSKRLMVGTSGKGILSVSLKDNYHPVIYDQLSGYENVRVSDMVTDSEGNFWVVSVSRGLDLFPALFEWILIEPADASSQVQALLYDSESNLWHATLKGLYRTHLDPTGGNRAEPIILRSGNRQPIITSMYEDFLKNIWIGTFDEGIFFKAAGSSSFIRIRQPDGLANDNVLSLSGDDNFVWISTLGGVTRCSMNGPIRRKSDLLFENFNGESGLHSNYIYQTFVDSKKRVWFATDGNGLKMLDREGFKTYDQIDSNKISTIYSIAEDKKGNIWFSTPSEGLYRFDGKNFTNYGMQSGISDLSITGIVADDNGDILLLENDAIDIFESKTNQVRRYRGRPPLDNISPNLNAYYKGNDGTIWIATQKGILKYYTPPLQFTHEARHEIRQVSVYLEAIDFKKIHKLKYNQNHLTFEFQAFWNSNPSQLRYRYMLEGHDLDWIKTKDERVIYPDLRPGSYTFRIQSTIHHNFDDAETKTYSFTITPPFWATWWFVSVVSLLTSILLFWLVKVRDKRREREEKLKRERIEFQLENLKSQINPHFLFNSFNTLATLVEEDQKIALSYIDHLSDFYRSLLAYKDTDLVTLQAELELTNNYIYLLQQRHGDRLNVITRIDEDAKQLMIPPLTLQLLIENAVKHNVVSKDLPLTVEIFTLTENRLCVKNNLQKKKDARSTGFGLQNIRARCELLGSQDFDIVEDHESFQVCVPLFKR